MGYLADKLNSIIFGGGNSADTATERPILVRANISPDGDVTTENDGTDLYLRTTGSGDADFMAKGRIWNAVWNDFADFQLLNDELVFGKCYYDTKDGARICEERCQMSVIGVASDTYGISAGSGANQREVPIAVAGWALAFVDQEYECGTPLTNDEHGNLTAMTRAEKLEYPERIIALYKRKEAQETWGPAGRKIDVKGRHWVKIK